jgi:serine/threonine-protein kinase
MSVSVGDVIDEKYRIVRLIGEGGMGAVYEGENTLIARRVAIKVLYGAAAMSAEAIARFEREAQAAGRIGNDHILEILDLGRLPDGSRYMVMEYLDGETLGMRIQRLGRMTPEELVVIFKQLLVGLQAAHEAGIVHRDLKPDNIFILKEKAGRKDFAKIIDFGISKFQESGTDHGMTRTGTVMGTPFYMSPEQAKGSRADPRSDLYAVGAMLYEAVSGTVPFDGKTFNELMFKIVLSDPQPLSELVPDLDLGFGRLVLKGMSKEPEQRFQSAREFGDALDRWRKTGLTFSGASNAVTLPEAVEKAVAKPVQTAAPRAGVTNGSWANSPPAPEKKSRVPWALVGGIGVLVLGGGALVATWIGHDASSPPAEPAASVEAPTVPRPPPPAPPESKREPLVVPVPTPDVSLSVAPEPSAPPLKEAPKVEAKPLAKPAASAAVRAAQKPVSVEPVKPAASARPDPVPAPKPAASAKAPAPAKPKVDFGY